MEGSSRSNDDGENAASARADSPNPLGGDFESSSLRGEEKIDAAAESFSEHEKSELEQTTQLIVQPAGQAKRRKRSKVTKKTRSVSSAPSVQSEDDSANSKQSKFIQKVYEMASCEENQHALGFSADGLSLEIRHVPALGSILGKYFKHNNPSSFIRQLNNYGFKTISSSALGINRHVFAHPHFKRDDSSLLETITRKTAVCVKKKSKGEIIKELQLKSEEQQAHVQQMEMHHLEMFQRIMTLEAENKQLRTHLEAMRRSFQETSSRFDNMADVCAVPPAGHPLNYQPRYRSAGNNPPPPPMFDNSGNPYYSTYDISRLAMPHVDMQGERDGLNMHDGFHLD